MGVFSRLRRRDEPEKSSLKYKTRGLTVPQGKTGLFFAAHPKDFPLVFEKISDAVLELCNCVIWYQDPGRTGAVAAEDLEQMQLFIFPVTTRFLARDNEARSRILPFALEHHKPVLPILMEEGIAQQFTRICGAFHAIPFSSSDPTEKPFQERLKEFLNAILTGDELTSKIRAAFDTYIFMSYRKKDRAYAQNLMRLIHRNEFCRDIAIWYDEFLVPGEGFNDSIREALEKSPLFALVVTPSILEPNSEGKRNYVQETEVPLAAEKGKVILPVEMKSLNRKKFLTGFPDLKDVPVVNSNDPAAIESALKDALRRIAWTPQEKDPQHTFFIGLAYLEGIDVESDPEKALKLIRKAAEDGLPEAAQKLAWIYRYGQGVERNFSTSIHFIRLYLDLLQKTAGNPPSREDMEKYAGAMIDLIILLSETHQQDEALENWIRLAERFTLEKQYPDLTFWAVFEANDKIGQILREQGEYARSLEYLWKNVEAVDSIREQWMPEEELLKNKAFAYNSYGRSLLQEERVNEAKEYFEKGLAAAERLDQMAPTIQHRKYRSASLSYLGNAYDRLGNHEEALEYFKKMQFIYRELMKTLCTPESYRDYAVSCLKVASQFFDMNQPEKALETMKEGLSEAQAAAEKDGTWENWDSLFHLALFVVEILNSQDRDDLVEEYARIALKSARAMEKINPDIEALEKILDAQIQLEENLRCKGKETEARSLASEMLEMAETAARLRPVPDNRHKLALCNLITSFFTDRMVYAKEAYNIWDMLCRESPGTLIYRKNLEAAVFFARPKCRKLQSGHVSCCSYKM